MTELTNHIPRIRVTDAERAEVERRADECGLNLTDYVRYCVTGAQQGRQWLNMWLPEQLKTAIQEVADDEGRDIADIVRELLHDVFIGERWFLVPVTGVVVDDPELENKVIPFPVRAEGQAA